MITLLFFGANAYGQDKQKLPLLGVTYLDVNGVDLSQNEVTSIVRIEIEKLQKFEVADRYEIENYYKTHNIGNEDCASKTCVLAAGKELKLDYVVSGTVEKIGRMLAISLREYNVKTGVQEASVVKEYIYQPIEMQSLIRFSVESLFGMPVKQELENLYLFQKHEEDLVNKPDVRKLNLSGPRFGLSMMTGNNALAMEKSKQDGGFNMYPMMTQFGYHSEVRYLNSGKVMALVEFLGLVGGMEQQKFIPSVSVINGFRWKQSKWEIGFGPTFNIQRRNANGLLDSRVSPSLTSSWVFAIGKTFTSGNLNIPVNLYTIPNKQGWTVGVSMGWSIEKQ